MVVARRIPAIAAGGLIAGTLDVVAAALMYGVSPDRIFKWVASGWLGRSRAMAGGLPEVLLGVASHYAIALIWAAVYVLAMTRLPILAGRPWLMGPLFGLGVWAIMYGIVVPLSRTDAGNMSVTMTIENVLIHTLVFGLPIALAAVRFSREKTA
jgi:hypothetical protein